MAPLWADAWRKRHSIIKPHLPQRAQRNTEWWKRSDSRGQRLPDAAGKLKCTVLTQVTTALTHSNVNGLANYRAALFQGLEGDAVRSWLHE